jgi:hypothetical protein
MYKIKFLDSLLLNREQTETEPIFKVQYFSDADLPEIAKHWQTLGIKKVISVEIEDDSKCKRFSVMDVINMFYPDTKTLDNGEVKNLSDHDKKAKEDLIKSIPGQLQSEKEYRAELFAKLEAAGKSAAKNIKTIDLEDLVKNI